MKSQAVIFLTLFCLIPLLSNARADVDFQRFQQLLATQGPCILNEAPCNEYGEMIKQQLSMMLRGCTLNGCERADSRIRELADFVRKYNEPLWRAVINKYVVHK